MCIKPFGVYKRTFQIVYISNRYKKQQKRKVGNKKAFKLTFYLYPKIRLIRLRKILNKLFPFYLRTRLNPLCIFFKYSYSKNIVPGTNAFLLHPRSACVPSGCVQLSSGGVLFCPRLIILYN